MRGPASSERNEKTERMKTNFNNPESTAELPKKPATAVTRAIINEINAQRSIRPPRFEDTYTYSPQVLCVNRTNATDGDRLVNVPVFRLPGLGRPFAVSRGGVPVLVLVAGFIVLNANLLGNTMIDVIRFTQDRGIGLR